MKKLFTLLLITTLFACSSEDAEPTFEAEDIVFNTGVSERNCDFVECFILYSVGNTSDYFVSYKLKLNFNRVDAKIGSDVYIVEGFSNPKEVGEYPLYLEPETEIISSEIYDREMWKEDNE